MRWAGRQQSSNVEDRRGMRGGGLAIGGGMGTIVIVLIALLLGANPLQILQQVGPGPGGGPGAVAPGGDVRPADEPLREFVAVILKDTEDVWNSQLPQQLGRRYVEPTLVLFENQVQSACGFAGSSVGPFYCPGDSNVYLDLSFFEQLSSELGAQGDAAMAYVIAHEVGHHVQNLLGVSEQAQRVQARASSQEEANRMSVRVELQADFLAGVFFHHAQRSKQILESGDIEEAVNAAKQIGDDILQRRAGGRVREAMFTHGSSEQRMRWLRRGMESGSLDDLQAPLEAPYDSL